MQQPIESSKAFELAAAYLQVRKEQRERIIIKTKLIHKARSYNYENSIEILH